MKHEFLSIPLPDLPVGGHLKYFVSFWKNLTHDLVILDMVTGMPLDLNSDIPSQFYAPQFIFTEQEMQAADCEISQLLAKHAIVPCSHSPTDLDSFMNNVFLVPKNSPIKGLGGLSKISKKMSIIELSRIGQNLFDFSDLT